MTFLVSRLRDESDNQPELTTVTWAAWKAELLIPRRTPCSCHARCACEGTKLDCKACGGSGVRRAGASNACRHKRGPAWAPAVFDGKRSKSCVRLITMLVLDLDHQPLGDLQALVDVLQTEKLEFVLHTTHSHRTSPDDACARLVFPLSRNVLPEEFVRLRERVCGVLGVSADDHAADPSRLFYLPSAPQEGPFWAVSGEGSRLEVDDWLSVVPTELVPAEACDTATDMEHLRQVLKATRDPLILLALAGKEPLAQEGERDATLQSLVSKIAFNVPPSTPPDAILSLIRASVLLMPGDPPEGMPDWLAMARFKLDRAVLDRRAKDEARARFQEEYRRRVGAASAEADASLRAADPAAKADEDITQPYPDERVAQWAAAAGCSVEEWASRWIISNGRAFWIWREGKYQTPVTKDDLEVILERDLARAPVKVKTYNEDTGVWKRRRVKEVLAEHSRVARHIETHLALQQSYFDPKTETFVEAACPLRPLQPEENPKIQAWLEMLGGDQTEQFLDWIATITRLDRQTCAVYIHAGPGVGKTLLASGLAKLWSRGGTSDLEDILAGFNDTLLQCPLVFVDEHLPPNLQHTTTMLRRLIGQTLRPLKRKFMPTSQMHGAIRFILAANNDRLLETGEELTPEDLEAVASRFLFLDPVKRTTQIAQYLHAVTPAIINRDWLDNDGIAKHALWLRQVRKVSDDGRFLVAGAKREFHERLVTASGVTGQIAEALILALTRADAGRFRADERIQMGEGRLWVATGYLGAYWGDLVHSRSCPSAAQIGRTLANLASGNYRCRTKTYGQLIYHEIKLALLGAWAEKTQLSDMDTLRSLVAVKNPFIQQALERKTP